MNESINESINQSMNCETNLVKGFTSWRQSINQPWLCFAVSSKGQNSSFLTDLRYHRLSHFDPYDINY